MVKHEKLANGDDVYSTEKGSIRVSRPGPGVVVNTLVGVLTEELLPAMTSDITAGEVEVFNDTTGVTQYSPEFRAAGTKRAQDSGKKRRLHTLVTSKLVAMGAAVFNLATGNKMKIYSDRIAFEAAIKNAVRAHQRGGASAAP